MLKAINKVPSPDEVLEDPIISGMENESPTSFHGTEAEGSTSGKISEVSSRDDSPEAMVRRENQSIQYMRILSVLVLLVAAFTTASLAFVISRQAEEDSFQGDFSLVSRAMAEGLLDDTARYFWAGQSVAFTYSLAMEAYNQSHLTMVIPNARYQTLINQASRSTNSFYISWSPLLRTDDERRTFEAMVVTKEEEGFFTGGPFPVCHTCGDENMAPSNTDITIDVAGIETLKCKDIYDAGENGLIDQNICPLATGVVIDVCECMPVDTSNATTTRKPSEGIFRFSDYNASIVDEPWTGGPYLPMWQDANLFSFRQQLLYNQLSSPTFAKAAVQMLVGQAPVFSDMYDADDVNFYTMLGPPPQDGKTRPAGLMLYPVRSHDGTQIIGTISIFLDWCNFLDKLVPNNGDLVDVVIESTCGQAHTYRVEPKMSNMMYVGKGDLHDPKYGHMMLRTSYDQFDLLRGFTASEANGTAVDSCLYRYAFYPTTAFEDEYVSMEPWIYATSVLLIFMFTTLVFFLYDFMVRRRQAKIMASAKRTDDIVASLFPQNVRERMYDRAQLNTKNSSNDALAMTGKSSKLQMESFLSGVGQASIFGSEPIADFFPSATVVFIDIANFTAWCSEREPTQVFVLLENLYHAFDEVGNKLGVFKVETIGDSYVAVSGVPTPRKDHAVVMTRFAHECLLQMEKRVKELELALGPSTGDLRARCGMHSGPVTAGVLRGAKARFQLFGDTVNTASRFESSGLSSRIHASQATVNFLLKAKKESWVISREDQVHLKGKGTLQTYWINPRGQTTPVIGTPSVFKAENCTDSKEQNLHSEKLERVERLVNWNVEMLHGLLEKLVSARNATAASSLNSGSQHKTASALTWNDKKPAGHIVLDELTEIIEIPRFDPRLHKATDRVVLSPNVKEQLRDFVSNIAHLYRDVPFHNFEHASHVIMSAAKLMKRIMEPEGIDHHLEGITDKQARKVEIQRQIHQVTYGLSSDPLMQFCVVFSALIHDVDHTGLTNKELIDKHAPVAAAYREKCVAEQNSVDVAWAVLMDDKYVDLRACIYTNEAELRRFRELIVDAVMATDIADKELGTLRKSRWADAFTENSGVVSGEEKCEPSVTAVCDRDMDRKATIVFEHIIQASDIAHCMQHWHTYQKFNARLFEERYIAYRKGVAGDNPPWVGWYKGEIWFYDNYIIPLAKKLHACGVFGVSYDEYLNYAQENRVEWERRGEEIVETLRANVEAKYANAVFSDDPLF